MNRIPLKVPLGVKFISDWEGYEIPYGKCIIDKKVCGCGYTQFCLNNKDHIILCSPRISLLENKAEQNPGTFYFKPVILSKKEIKFLGLKTDEEVSRYCLDLQRKLLSGYISDRYENCLPVKILVTYDSFPKLMEILHFLKWKDLENSKTIVDEFQLVFSDARFKAGVEIDFIEYLDTYCNNVVYLSGTPMLEEYLLEIPEFQKLDYYEFIWAESSLSKINITRIPTSNLEKTAVELVNLYKMGNGPEKQYNGVLYKSKEVVLFVNNVSMITSIIKGSGLSPEEVNIITAKTSENLRKIKKCGKGFGFGSIPLRGEKHKLVTFCTSTAFCGVDMYSETAKAYVFSDCNLKTMAIDISIELPQIVGRQRLESNIFRQDITIYYTKSIHEYTEEDFKREINRKIRKTETDMSMFSTVKKSGDQIDLDNLRRTLRYWICGNSYKEDYTSLSRETGEPVLNRLMMVSDIRSWEMQNRIYRNEKEVISVLSSVGILTDSDSVTEMLEKSISFSDFRDRFKFIYEYILKHPEEKDNIPECYLKYVESDDSGDVIKKSLRKDVLEKRLKEKENKSRLLRNTEFLMKLYDSFSIGGVYSRKEVKDILNSVFKECFLEKENIIFKATDITEFFNVNSARIVDPISGKLGNAIRILSIKE